MRPLRPKHLAIQVRLILNNWPAFTHIRPKPAVLAEPYTPTALERGIAIHEDAERANYDSKGAALLAAGRAAVLVDPYDSPQGQELVQRLRDKQAYLQSLDQPGA